MERIHNHSNSKTGKDPYDAHELPACSDKLFGIGNGKDGEHKIEPIPWNEWIRKCSPVWMSQKKVKTDHLIRLETEIRKALVYDEHLVSVFYDLEKAYDRTWRYGILKYV